jgi:hypothetical protein
MEKGTPIPVIITAYQDRSFTFEMKQPPVSFFLKKAIEDQVRLQDAGPRLRRQGDQGADRRDRREEDGRSQLRYGRIRLRDDRRFRPLDGPEVVG